MEMPKISLLQWQKRYGTEKACVSTLTKYRWQMASSVPNAAMIHPIT